jgi:crotonobetainyl-CoA:carnitine CoA-transferase CaiB-like acyl-CoA transferase
LGYDDLYRINKIIYGSANGYGPDSDQPSFDGSGQVRSGIIMSDAQLDQDYSTVATQGDLTKWA